MQSTTWPRRGVAAIVALGCFLAGAAGCGGSDGSSAPAPSSDSGAATASNEQEPEVDEDAIAIRVAEVSRGALSSLYGTSATLRADKQATVTARTTGVIRELLVEEGDTVEGGQLLAVLEDDEQRIEFQRAKSELETSLREYARALSLHDQLLLSQEEYEATRRDSEQAKHAAELAELVLSRTMIRAPFTGSVLTRHLDVGATVNDGTAVYAIGDLDPLYADVNVPERQVSRLAVGQSVRLVADASGETAQARIERLAPAVDPETGTVKVTLAVRGPARLRPGGFVRVEIVTETHDDAMVVPRTALVAEGRRWHVFRLDSEEGNTAERLEVELGFEEDQSVEILASPGSQRPLRVGDRVVVVGASALSDGAPVRVVEPESAESDDAAGVDDGDEDGGVSA